MAIVTNNLSLDSLIEFTRKGLALDLDSMLAAGLTPSSTLEDLLSTPGVLLPSAFGLEAEDSDILKGRDFLFCNPPIPVETPEAKICPSCKPDLARIPEDWRAKPNLYHFFDESTCRYSIVVETVIASNRTGVRFGLPEIPERVIYNIPSGNDLKYFITAGIVSLLRQKNKTETLTAVMHIPSYSNSVDNSKIENVDSKKFNTKFISDLIAGAATSNFTILGASTKKPGYRTVIEEFDTVDELYPLAEQIYNDNAESSVFCPLSPGLPTKILVSVPVEIFDKLPDRFQNKSPISGDYNTDLEVTLTGADISDTFISVANEIRRAKLYLDNRVFGPIPARIYNRGAAQDALPVVLDFNTLGEQLKDFFRTLLKDALRTVYGITFNDLEKVIINFAIDPNTAALSIVEITFNKVGCPDVLMSAYKDVKPEIKALFNYSNSVVLGYIAKLPDMREYLEGKENFNYIEFLLNFTYPGLEIRNQSELLFGEEKDDMLKCISEFSLKSIVNKLLGGLIELPNMFLGGLSNEACKDPEDEREMIFRAAKIRQDAREAILARIQNFQQSRTFNNLNAAQKQTIAEQAQTIKTNIETQRNILGTYERAYSTSVFPDGTPIGPNLEKQILDGYETQQQEFLKTNILAENPTLLPATQQEIENVRTQLIQQQQNKVLAGVEEKEKAKSAQTAKVLESQLVALEEINGLLQELYELEDSPNRPKKEKFKQAFDQNMKEKAALTMKAVAKQQPLLDIILNAVFPKAGSVQEVGNNLVPASPENTLVNLVRALDGSGGWCAYVQLGLEATECIRKGLGAEDLKQVIVKSILKQLTPFQFQKLFRNLPPNLREDVRKSLEKAIPGLVCGIFPWECSEEAYTESNSYSASDENAEKTITSRKKDNNVVKTGDGWSEAEAIEIITKQASVPPPATTGATETEITPPLPQTRTIINLAEELQGVSAGPRLGELPVPTTPLMQQNADGLSLEGIIQDSIPNTNEYMTSVDGKYGQQPTTRTSSNTEELPIPNYDNLIVKGTFSGYSPSPMPEAEPVAETEPVGNNFGKNFREAYLNERSEQGIKAGSMVLNSLQTFTNEVTQVFIDSLLENVRADELLALLKDFPGVGFALKIAKDFDCLIPATPRFKPSLNSFIKDGRMDLCKIGGKDWIKFSLPQFDPPLKTSALSKEEIRLGKKIARREKNEMIREKMLEVVVDLLTQFLITAVKAFFETLLDTVCNMVSSLASNLAEMATGNSKIKQDLKDAMCQDGLSDDQFMDALRKILNGLYGGRPETAACTQQLTNEAMFDYFESLMASLAYGQIYDLLLGRASPETLAIATSIAKYSEYEAIRCIFSDPVNAADYFQGVGDMVNASGVIDSVPANTLELYDGTVCPPNSAELLENLRIQLLEDRGLNPEEVRKQLNFLKDQAKNKMEQLLDFVENGPWGNLPEIMNDAECPSDAIMGTPFLNEGLSDLAEGIFKPIEKSLYHDLVGPNSAINSILSDTNGNGLAKHNFLLTFFGNDIGQKNVDFEFYSNNTIKYSRVDYSSGTPKIEFKQNRRIRIDQFGRELDPIANDLSDPNDFVISQPAGGFPPTIGAYLMKRYQDNNIGLVDTKNPSFNISEISKPSFSTRRIQVSELEERDKALAFNKAIIDYRKELVSKWALAVGLIDSGTAFKYIKSEQATQYTKETDAWVTEKAINPTYNERYGIFINMINACNKPLFGKMAVNINYPLYSPENRVESVLGHPDNADLREINVNGRLIGIDSTIKREIKKFLEGNGINAGLSADQVRQAVASGSEIPKNREIGYFGNFNRPLSKQTARFFLEVYYMHNTAGPFETENDQDKVKYYKEFRYQNVVYLPDTPLENVPSINPYELAFSYLSYPKAIGLTVKNNKELAKPEWGFDLTYDFNIENVLTQQFDERYKNHFRVVLTEKLNPFSDSKLSAKDKSVIRQELKDLQNSSVNPSDEVSAGSSSPVVGSPDSTDILRHNLLISSMPTEEIQNYVQSLLPDGTPVKDINFSYESEFFNRYLIDRLKKDLEAPDNVVAALSTIDSKNRINKLFDFINEGFVRRISDRIGFGSGEEMMEEFDNLPKDTPEGEGKKVIVPEGWRFGYDPFAEVQTFILDFETYGGTEENPPFYLQPPKFPGWLGVMQLINPPEDACEPARIPLNSLEDLKREIPKLSQQLQEDERLNLDPFCTKEAPYDSIFSSSVMSSLESVIRATCRAYGIDIALRMIPIIRQFHFNFNNNFDELMAVYVANHITNNIKEIDQKRAFKPVSPKVVKAPDGTLTILGPASAKPRLSYYYGFLEVIVTLTFRKIASGLLKMEDLTINQQNAITAIQDEVERYYKDYDFTEAVLSEEAIAAQNMFNRIFNSSVSRKIPTIGYSPTFSKMRAKRIKNALSYEVLVRTEEQAKALLSIYTKEEMDRLATVLNKKFNAPVESLDFLFLSSYKFANGAADITRSPVGGDVTTASGPYNVTNNPKDPTKFNISLENFTDENIKLPREAGSQTGKRWPFVLEKYMIVEDRPPSTFTELNLSSKLRDRDPGLKGIINIDSWYSYVQELIDSGAITGNEKISDIWGTREKTADTTDGEEVVSGWRWGLRLSILLDPDDEVSKPFVEILSKAGDINILKNKAYVVATPQGKKLLIPLVNAEQELKDQPISSFKPEQYDLVCLIWAMINKTEFKTLFRYVFPYKRYLSLLSVYCINSYFDSIGNSGPPSEGGDRWYIPGGKANSTFKKWDREVIRKPGSLNGNTANILMLSFLALYRQKNKIDRSQRNPFKFRFEIPEFLKTKNMLQFILDRVDDIPWFQRKNMVDRPFDANDQECYSFEPEEDL